MPSTQIQMYVQYIRICALGINVHNDVAWMRIEPILFSSEAGLKQNALTIRPQRHTFVQSNEKYMDRQSNFVTTGKKIMIKL